MDRSIKKLSIEAVSIGIITAIIATVLQILLNTNSLIIPFLSGAIIHVFFEYLDLNKIWCKHEFGTEDPKKIKEKFTTSKL
jgi:hypothetical protein